MLDMCTNGPTFPSGKPLLSASVKPIAFAIKTRNERYSFNTTPRSIVFISGMPLPIACGAIKFTMIVEAKTSAHGIIIQTAYLATIFVQAVESGQCKKNRQL